MYDCEKQGRVKLGRLARRCFAPVSRDERLSFGREHEGWRIWQEPWSKAKTDAVRACLAKMLETNVFAHAERQKRLLAYLVSQTLAGHGDRLKGYTIAIDVFDRSSDFDPAVEPIVRVETARLRAKLREYYAVEGRLDPVRIEIPKGAYLVRICEIADGRQGGADAVGKKEEKPSLARYCRSPT